ncbi:MAG: hypothetical protein JXQ73_31090 [Phycisphaerae bacterium]|nr:hypothetical protein [Phycisphaerae bacterium]
MHVPCVLGASTCFVLAPVAGGALGSAYGQFVVVGLIAFWCGDVLGAPYFVTGVLAFCVGHAAFVCAFIAKGIAWKRLMAALVPVVIAVVIILRWLLPHVEPPAEIAAVCAYSIVISIMVLAAFGASEGPVGRLILAAAVIIYVSDIFVARWKYVDFGAINGRLCYPLYYTGCLILGMTVVARKCWSTDASPYRERYRYDDSRS